MRRFPLQEQGSLLNRPLNNSLVMSRTNKHTPAIKEASLPIAGIFFFILLHLPLALAMKQYPVLATAHALLTFGVGMIFLMRDNEAVPLVYVIAYITGAEIVWRATGAAVFYEFGKISISVLLAIALFKQSRLQKIAIWPIFYLVLLLPGIAYMPAFDRETLSFILGGHIALVVISMYFSTVTLNRHQLMIILVALVAPALGMTAIASYTTLTAEAIYFGRNSLFITAGNIGPDQVSFILGLGILAAFLFVMVEHGQRFLKLFMLACALWMFAQALLTFSRGGIWAALGALVVAVFFLIRNRRQVFPIILFLSVIIAIFYFFLLPRLNDYTGGAMVSRFESLNLTRRDVIARLDLKIFSENPIFGVGVGQSMILRDMLTGSWDAPHIEYTRLLAEHGLLGLACILILFGVAFQRFGSNLSLSGKAFIMSFTLWAFLFLFAEATRLVAPAFLFGLASACIMIEEEK
jgi:O-antigen ligase